MYCAIELDEGNAVSVIHTEEAEDHTKLNGWYVNEDEIKGNPLPVVSGGTTPDVNELRPPVEGIGDEDESVYMSAWLLKPHPSAPAHAPLAPRQAPA